MAYTRPFVVGPNEFPKAKLIPSGESATIKTAMTVLTNLSTSGVVWFGSEFLFQVSHCR